MMISLARECTALGEAEQAGVWSARASALAEELKDEELSQSTRKLNDSIDGK